MSSPAQPAILHPTPVLVVKDDFNLCRLVVEILTLEGYLVTPVHIVNDPAEDARIVLDALKYTTHPIIVLLDPVILLLGGTEPLAAYLQDKARRQPHLFYLMTPLLNPAQTCAHLHADGFLPMPFSPDDLIALIAGGERLLRDRAAPPPDPFTLDC